MRISKVIGTVILAMLVVRTHAQTHAEATALLDEWLAAQVDYQDLPSISVAFIDNDQIIYKNAFGFANREAGLQATTTTLYSICSISKLFTSIAVMQQRDAGKLSLRDPIARHLDWYKVEQRFPLSDEVTIEGVLTHSSGLPREVDIPYWSASEAFPFPAREDAIAATQSQSTLYRAWENFQYSNLGIMLAGEVVAAVSGENYHQYINTHILRPLGMSNTFTSMPKHMHGAQLAIGYGASPRQGEREALPFFNAQAIDAAAGFAANVEDLAKFASWQLGLLDGKGDSVLDHNTLREMYRPHSVLTNWQYAWGLGFSLRKTDFGTLIGHGGSCPGYRSQLAILPDEKVAAVVMINAGGEGPYSYVKNLVEILLPVVGQSDEDKSVPALADYKGVYNSQPWDDEVYITPWGSELIGISLSDADPMDEKFTLKQVEGDSFVRIRGGETYEPVVFQRDEHGKVTGLVWHSTVTKKVR